MINMPEIKKLDNGGCVCYGEEGIDSCVCLPEERVLRLFSYGLINAEMNDQQREECLAQIDCVEGHSRNFHKNDSDSALADAVLDAWLDYARDKGLA